jgi:hypothetical protein
MMIYRAALVELALIDLWLHVYVEKAEESPALTSRITKAQKEVGLSDTRFQVPPAGK